MYSLDKIYIFKLKVTDCNKLYKIVNNHKPNFECIIIILIINITVKDERKVWFLRNSAKKSHFHQKEKPHSIILFISRTLSILDIKTVHDYILKNAISPQKLRS